MPNQIYELWNNKYLEAKRELEKAKNRGAGQNEIDKIRSDMESYKILRDRAASQENGNATTPQGTAKNRAKTPVKSNVPNNKAKNTNSSNSNINKPANKWKDSIRYDVNVKPKSTPPKATSTRETKSKTNTVVKPKTNTANKKVIKKPKTPVKKKNKRWIALGMAIAIAAGYPVGYAIQRKFISEPTYIITQKKARENLKEYNKIAEEKISAIEASRYKIYLEQTNMDEDLELEEFEKIVNMANQKWRIKIPDNIEADYKKYKEYANYVINDTDWTMDIAGIELIDGSALVEDEER